MSDDTDITSSPLIMDGVEIADIRFGCVRILCERGSVLDDEQAQKFAKWLMLWAGDGRAI